MLFRSKLMNPAVVLLAAGSGSRFGNSTNKVWLPLAGKSVICRTIENAHTAFPEAKLLLIINPDDEVMAREIISKEIPTIKIEITYGGDTRHASEYKALMFLKDEIESGAIDIVLIHDGARPLASPAARRRAVERGVDLIGVSGTGPDGAIVSSDIERASAAQPAKRRGLDFGEMRKAIAAAMVRSKREIPHYYLSHSVDMTDVLAWLGATNAARSPTERLLPVVLLLKAVALALREMPEFNGVYGEGGFTASGSIHVGTAIAIRGGGLIAPAIHDADRLSLVDLMAALRDLVSRVRAGRLRSSELTDPTITVSSLGERGVDGLFGVIYPPQVALVGFGTPVLRPWIRDGVVVPRSVMVVTLAADHRVSDGHRGALLLLEIERLLREPEML